MHITDKELKKYQKNIGYKGCRNCSHRPPHSNMCDWGSRGGDHHIHFICPKWKKVIE